MKHGRLAMLAFVGICTAEWGQGVRIPLFNGIEGPAIYHYQQVYPTQHHHHHHHHSLHININITNLKAQELVPYLSLAILTIIGSLEAYRYQYQYYSS